MGWFVKKPVVIEAEQLNATNVERLAKWCGGYREFLTVTPPTLDNVQIVIPTLEGKMWARTGDWIIKGVKGEFYPCKDNIFQETYSETEPF